MTRIGWVLLALFALLAGGFALSLSDGGEIATPSRPAGSRAEAPPAPGGALAIPVAGVARAALTDSWGQERAGGARGHKAIDIMAPRGTPVMAAAPGRVEKLFESQDGGRTVYVRSPDGRTITYYAHLDAYRPGLAEGQRVRTGDLIGTVGSTGNADPAAPHLHFEVKAMAPGESWWQGTERNPYPLLAGKGP
jgi:murein DD-endopeptidase MepM/ murein hydrolase activator NlpD